MKNSGLLFAVSLLPLLIQVRARAWTPATYPDPNTDLASCGRGVSSAICDPDGVLTKTGADTLEGEINQIRAGVSPYATARCGAVGLEGFQIAVAVMKHFAGGDSDDAPQEAAAFAQALHDDWGVGSAACNNGVLVLLATVDRQLYISTGSAAAERLPHETLAAIMARMKPALRAGHPDTALLDGVVALGLALAGHSLPPEPEEDGGGVWIFGFFAAVVASVFGWGWWSNRHTQRRYAACQNALARIKADQGRLRRQEYTATSCPICLEDFVDDEEEGAPSAPPIPVNAQDSGASPERAALLAPSTSAAATSSKSGGAAPVRRVRRPLALRCGHVFCTPCISQWLAAKTTCPICRKGVDDPPDGDRAAAPAAPPRTCAASVAPPPRDVLVPEMAFRLRQLRLMYPDFVTDPMVWAWQDDLLAGRDIDAGAVAAQRVRSAAHRARMAELGSHGTSAGFGGGSSHGGGGGGTSW